MVESKRAVLDNSIQVDRVKMPSRRAHLEHLLSEYSQTYSTGISLLEFKATVIEQLVKIHNQMRRKGARFTIARDILLEKKHRQVSLRAHIFNNLLHVYGRAGEISEQEDEALARKAAQQIENVVEEVYWWFRNESATVYLNQSQIDCTRADEPPIKRKVAFSTNLPRCVPGNRRCRVEEFIRENGRRLRDALIKGLDENSIESESQLGKTCEMFSAVMEDQSTRMSVDDCRRCGDALIALEGLGVATHAVSTNASEWAFLCEVTGIRFHHVSYNETLR